MPQVLQILSVKTVIKCCRCIKRLFVPWDPGGVGAWRGVGQECVCVGAWRGLTEGRPVPQPSWALTPTLPHRLSRRPGSSLISGCCCHCDGIAIPIELSRDLCSFAFSESLVQETITKNEKGMEDKSPTAGSHTLVTFKDILVNFTQGGEAAH